MLDIIKLLELLLKQEQKKAFNNPLNKCLNCKYLQLKYIVDKIKELQRLD